MRHYSLRFLSESGRVVRRYDFQADNDREAMGAANAVIGTARGELRAAHRRVAAWRAEGLDGRTSGA